MTSRRGTSRVRGALSGASGELRPLVVLAVVVGVLAMHALTVGHHPVPVASSAGSASSASSASSGIGAMRDVGNHAGRFAAGTPEVRVIVRDAADSCAGCGHGGPGSSHTVSHLLELCLGVLLAVALVSLLSRRARGGSVLPDPVFRWQVRLSVFRRPRPPSLSELCVLRT